MVGRAGPRLVIASIFEKVLAHESIVHREDYLSLAPFGVSRTSDGPAFELVAVAL